MLSSKSLYNKRVYVDGKKKNLGHIRAFVFLEKNCIGFVVKRPDFLWMFHRAPGFVALKDCTINKSGVLLKNTKALVKNSQKDENVIN